MSFLWIRLEDALWTIKFVFRQTILIFIRLSHRIIENIFAIDTVFRYCLYRLLRQYVIKYFYSDVRRCHPIAGFHYVHTTKYWLSVHSAKNYVGLNNILNELFRVVLHHTGKMVLTKNDKLLINHTIDNIQSWNIVLFIK